MKKLKQIIKGCRKNRRADQYALYSHFSSKMYGICLRYAQSYDEAQDILQEGFIKVFENIKSLREIKDIEGWIRRIIVNVAIDKYRSRVNEMDIVEEFKYVRFSNNNLGIEQLNIGDLLDMIHTLPSQYRIVFNLYALEGFSHKEIAKQLNITESTSRSNLARARLILQKALSNEQKVVQKVV